MQYGSHSTRPATGTSTPLPPTETKRASDEVSPTRPSRERTSSSPRSLWNADQGYEPALKAFDSSIDKLGVDYVDLYLNPLATAGQRPTPPHVGRARKDRGIGPRQGNRGVQLRAASSAASRRTRWIVAPQSIRWNCTRTSRSRPFATRPPSTGSRSNRGAHSAVPVTQVGVRRPSPTPCSPTRSSLESVTATARLPRRS